MLLLSSNTMGRTWNTKMFFFFCAPHQFHSKYKTCLLLQKVSRNEENKEKQQPTIDEQGLLVRSEGIAPQSKLLVLSEPGDLHTLTLEEHLCCPARRAPPVRRQLAERHSRRHWVQRVAGRFVVEVPAGPALVDPGVQHHELLLRAGSGDGFGWDIWWRVRGGGGWIGVL